MNQDYLKTPDRKRAYNARLFATVAPRYDHITRLLSFWKDQRWKRTLVTQLETHPDARIIDLACGTGDLTALLSRKLPRGRIIGIDLSPAMLDAGHDRLRRLDNVRLLRADMGAIPLPGNYADAITGGYALRNAPEFRVVLAEIYRVLRPGGTAAFLDFSRSSSRLFAPIQHQALWWWGAFWGWLVHRDPSVYTYIAESLRAFPNRQSLEGLIAAAGFERIVTRCFSFGAIAIVTFRKPSPPAA